MTIYTYDTSADEEAAMDYDQAVVNGQRMSANPPLPPMSKQELFVYGVSNKWLRQSAMQRLQAQFDPMIQAFMAADLPTRDKMKASFAASVSQQTSQALG